MTPPTSNDTPAAAPAEPPASYPACLEALEDMARQHCHTGRQAKDHNGLKAGTMVTDSGGLSADADALRALASHRRFRIVAEYGRMVCGYWPENDPEPNPSPEPRRQGGDL